MAGGLGPEVLFTLNNFQQQQKLSIKETVAQMIFNIFTWRPGNLPSMPHIGMDIENRYMYKTQLQLDPEELKKELYSQCAELVNYITLGEVQVFITDYNGAGVLIIRVPIQGLPEETTILYGFTRSSSSEGTTVKATFQFEDTVITS